MALRYLIVSIPLVSTAPYILTVYRGQWPAPSSWSRK